MKMLIIAGTLFTLSAILSGLPQTFWQLIVARFIGGIGVGVASVLSPIYIAEIAPARVRGRLVAVNQLAIVVGILLTYISNWLLVGKSVNDWRWMFAVDDGLCWRRSVSVRKRASGAVLGAGLWRMEMRPLVDAILRYQQTGIANNAIVLGSRGSGKSLSARYLMKTLANQGYLKFLYVNYRQHNTSFKIMAAILGVNPAGMTPKNCTIAN